MKSIMELKSPGYATFANPKAGKMRDAPLPYTPKGKGLPQGGPTMAITTPGFATFDNPQGWRTNEIPMQADLLRNTTSLSPTIFNQAPPPPMPGLQMPMQQPMMAQQAQAMALRGMG